MLSGGGRRTTFPSELARLDVPDESRILASRTGATEDGPNLPEPQAPEFIRYSSCG